MPKVSVFDTAGEQVSVIELSDAVFGINPNAHAMHLAVVGYLARQRQGTQSALTRAEVRGGGKKPWRQKGTGRARQGSNRSPQWTHGGIVFAPKPRTYGISLNKKVRRLALKSALSAKVQGDELIVVDKIDFAGIKTKEFAGILRNLDTGKKTLVVLPENNEVLYKSARNIEGVKVAQVNTLNVYDILNANKLIVLQDAVGKIEEVYA